MFQVMDKYFLEKHKCVLLVLIGRTTFYMPHVDLKKLHMLEVILTIPSKMDQYMSSVLNSIIRTL